MTAPTYAVRIPGAGRAYRFPDQPSIDYPSVTTVIGLMDKPALKPWGERTVAEYAVDNIGSWSGLDRGDAVDLLKRAPYRTSTAKADLGTLAHNLLEIGNEPAAGSPARGYYQAGKAWLQNEVAEVIHVEATLRNPQHVYAGTADVICVLKDGRLALADYKTSKSIGYPEQALQLVALAGCSEQVHTDGSVTAASEPSVGIVVRLGPTGHWETRYVDLLNPDGTWTAAAAATVYWFLGLRAAWAGKRAWSDGQWDAVTKGRA